MRKLFVILILLPMLALCACSKDTQNKHDKLFEHLAAAESFSASVDVTAQYSDGAATFSFDFSGNDSGSTLTLTAPSDIEGIAVTLDKDGAVVGYEGVSIAVGAFGEQSTNPAELLPKLIYLWQNVMPFEMGAEKVDGVDCLSAAWNDSGYVWRTWFSQEDYSPAAAEVLKDGTRVLLATFSDAEANKREE